MNAALPILVSIERERRRRQERQAGGAWPAFAARVFGESAVAQMADRHRRAWAWFAALERGVAPAPLIECWGRGGGKSSAVEAGIAWIGTQTPLPRRFVLYVSRTQTQANAHVQAVAGLLEAQGAERAVNKYQQSKGWTQSLLRTAGGYNVLAFGLDAAMRGIKIDLFRPDLIVLDDIDDKTDTPDATAKKTTTITETVLPAGSDDAAVVFVQNLIHADSIMAQLADGRADFLHDRGPVIVEPAVRDLQIEQETTPAGTRYRVTGGVPTWVTQDLTVVERQINTWGRRAFLREAQHEVQDADGGLWDRQRDIAQHRVVIVPDLARIVVALDPSATSTGDAAGIVVAGVDRRGHAYVLEDLSLQGSPKAWAEAAVTGYHLFRADRLIAESNNGGEMISATIKSIPHAPPVQLIHASRGKLTRAEPVQKLYEDGRVHHVGTFAALEDELCRWSPGDPSPNRLDALVWAITALLIQHRPPAVRTPFVSFTGA